MVNGADAVVMVCGPAQVKALLHLPLSDGDNHNAGARNNDGNNLRDGIRGDNNHRDGIRDARTHDDSHRDGTAVLMH